MPVDFSTRDCIMLTVNKFTLFDQVLFSVKLLNTSITAINGEHPDNVNVCFCYKLYKKFTMKI